MTSVTTPPAVPVPIAERNANPRIQARPLLRTVLFFLPLAVIFGVPAMVLWLGGELTHPDTVVARLARGDREILFGPAYTDSVIYVKTRWIQRECPRLLALGNSRVMQFRAGFFQPDTRFYNAGGCVQRILHFRAFLEGLPAGSLPATLIVGTDASFFATGFDKLDRDEFNRRWLDEQISVRPSASEIFGANWQKVWEDIGAGKVDFSRLLAFKGLSTHIGLSAVCKEKAFRNDGSFLYDAVTRDITNPAHEDHAFKRTLMRIEKGSDRFSWCSAPNPKALEEIDALLEFCAQHHIHVIGFLPPYAHAVWTAMQARGEEYAYIAKLAPELRRRFEQRGDEFYDFSDLAMLGAPDTEAIDGFHGSERVYLRLLIAMLERGSRLNACADLPALRARLENELSSTLRVSSGSAN